MFSLWKFFPCPKFGYKYFSLRIPVPFYRGSFFIRHSDGKIILIEVSFRPLLSGIFFFHEPEQRTIFEATRFPSPFIGDLFLSVRSRLMRARPTSFRPLLSGIFFYQSQLTGEIINMIWFPSPFIGDLFLSRILLLVIWRNRWVSVPFYRGSFFINLSLLNLSLIKSVSVPFYRGSFFIII